MDHVTVVNGANRLGQNEPSAPSAPPSRLKWFALGAIVGALVGFWLGQEVTEEKYSDARVLRARLERRR